jgi:nucleoside 2-deoxyribosyltransferase
MKNTIKVYLIGSLRNPAVPELANELRVAGFEVFDDWYSAGERADDSWQAYENIRGRDYKAALKGFSAQMIFNFDKKHIDEADAVVLLLPAGKSGHLELGYALGQGKPGYILFDKVPERYDVMYNFATDVFFDKTELIEELLICCESI